MMVGDYVKWRGMGEPQYGWITSVAGGIFSMRTDYSKSTRWRMPNFVGNEACIELVQPALTDMATEIKEAADYYHHITRGVG